MNDPTSTLSGPLVEFQGAGKSFLTKDGKVVHAVEDISFDVYAGEFVALVGPSGCGKSTALNVLSGLTDLTRGRALIRGQPPIRSRMEIGYVFQQDSRLLPWKRVLDNVMLGLKIRKVPKARAEARAHELLGKMQLDGFERSFPSELSGGMRKRVSLAATLAYNPEILLMDEPFGALDAQTRILLQDELLTLWEESKKTILFVTHDLGEAISLADRVIVMTARPARIKAEHKIPLPRPRRAETARFDDRFDSIYKSIWEDIRPELDIQKGE